jgi:hypothetical protein
VMQKNRLHGGDVEIGQAEVGGQGHYSPTGHGEKVSSGVWVVNDRSFVGLVGL